MMAMQPSDFYGFNSRISKIQSQRVVQGRGLLVPNWSGILGYIVQVRLYITVHTPVTNESRNLKSNPPTGHYGYVTPLWYGVPTEGKIPIPHRNTLLTWSLPQVVDQLDQWGQYLSQLNFLRDIWQALPDIVSVDPPERWRLPILPSLSWHQLAIVTEGDVKLSLVCDVMYLGSDGGIPVDNGEIPESNVPYNPPNTALPDGSPLNPSVSPPYNGESDNGSTTTPNPSPTDPRYQCITWDGEIPNQPSVDCSSGGAIRCYPGVALQAFEFVPTASGTDLYFGGQLKEANFGVACQGLFVTSRFESSTDVST